MARQGLYGNIEERWRDMLIANAGPGTLLRLVRDADGTLHVRPPTGDELDDMLATWAAAITRLAIDRAMTA